MSGTTYAQSLTTLTVSNCSNDSQLQSAVSQANSDNAGDTINFSCGGDIKLSNTLNISGIMTIDGSGQSVTIDGQNSVRVLSVFMNSSSSTFTLNALTIANGSSPSGQSGGGLYNQNGTVKITNSTFANNLASAGGGIDNSGGTVTINNSTFANNSAGQGGGGAINGGGVVTITNSTFANNLAGFGGGGGFGGAIFNGGGGSTMNITNSTFANNSASNNETGGIYNTGTVNIGESIVANNTGGNCSSTFGTQNDQGYNLESATDCGFTGTGDLHNTDPKLDPNGLQNNGGPTQTVALQQNSPAIDQIPLASCLSTDQRGDARPDDFRRPCAIWGLTSPTTQR